MDKNTRIFRVMGILAVICVVIFSCSATEDLSQRPLYSIDKYEYVDLDEFRRPLYKTELLLAKEPGPMQHSVVTLEKYAHRGQMMYSMDVLFVGEDWRYLDEIILNIDGESITLRDDDPIRIRKSQDAVSESLTCFLDEVTFKGLRFCKSLSIQYDQKPIAIPQEGLEAIWNFLRE